jgi:hypothetical protein
MRTHKNKTKSNNLKNKITIDIDFTSPDKGYSALLNPKLIKFLHSNLKVGNNLINTQKFKPFFLKEKTKLYLQAIPITEWKFGPQPWDKILCDEYNDFIKMTPCDIGKNTKLFVKLKSNNNIGGLATYLIALQLGIIDLDKHKQFVKALNKTFKSNPIIIHNLDVDWFHLKQYNASLE